MRFLSSIVQCKIMERYVKVFIVLYLITLANVLYLYTNIRGIFIQTSIFAGLHSGSYRTGLYFSNVYTHDGFLKNEESLNQTSQKIRDYFNQATPKIRDSGKANSQPTKTKWTTSTEINTHGPNKQIPFLEEKERLATTIKNSSAKVRSSGSEIRMASSTRTAKPSEKSEVNGTQDGVVFDRKLLELYHNQTMKYRRSGICSGLFKNNSRALQQAKNFTHSEFKKDFTLEPNQVLMMTKNCEVYRRTRRFPTDPLSKEESAFPLAFSILTYNRIEQLERFIRVLYQPQNVYCIHVDIKSSSVFQQAVRSIANCFDNVFVASKLESVVYASFARLKADINCMSDLLERKEKWKYLLNFASSELPLKSNIEMVRILKLFRGANDVREVFARRAEHRYKYSKFAVVNGRLQRLKKFMSPPPFNLTIVKGLAYNIFSQAFVQFALSSKISRTFLKWCQDTYSPDEHYWATLNNLYHNSFLNSPGGYKGHPDSKSYVTRYINWKASFYHCYGEYVRNICVFGYGDLPLLKRKGQFAANKFDIRQDAIVYSCMEDLLENKGRSPSKIDTKFWTHLNFVKQAYRP